MSVIIKSSIVPVVTISGTGKPVASSLDVAEAMGKRHGSIIRSIRQLDCSSDFRKHHFVFSKYKTPENRRGYPICEMTREGFSLLMSDLGSPAAMRFMESYINEFSRMEAALKATPAPVPVVAALPDFTNPAIAARAWADQFDRAEAAESVLNRFSTASGLIGQRDAAKALGISLKEVGCLITETFGWGFRDGGGKLKAYADAQRGGFLKERAGATKAGHAYVNTYLTPKALKIIAEYLCKSLTDAEISGLLTDPEAANDWPSAYEKGDASGCPPFPNFRDKS